MKWWVLALWILLAVHLAALGLYAAIKWRSVLVSALSRLAGFAWVVGMVAVSVVSVPYFKDAPPLVRLAAGLAPLGFALMCVKLLRTDNGVPVIGAVEFLGMRVRTVTSGPVLLFTPIGLPVERIASTVTLKEEVIDDKMDGETEDEEVVPLDFSIEHIPVQEGFFNYLSFTKGGTDLKQLADAIKQRVKSILSIEVRKRKKRDDVYTDLADISRTVQEEFNLRHKKQYGVSVRFMIDDPDLPEELVKEEVKREIQKKENERRGIEFKKMKAMALSMVKESEKRGDKPVLTLEKAMDSLKVLFKIVPETRSNDYKDFDIGVRFADVAKAVVPLFAKKTGKRRAGP